MEQYDVPPVVPDHRRRNATGLVGVGLLAGLVLGGLGFASAQSADPTPAPNESVQPDRRPDLGTLKRRLLERAERLKGARGIPFELGFGHGFGRGVLHGEFTVPGPDGGYQTFATQVGEVTAVSATSVTVKSEDGYSRTYAVDDNTLVNAGNEGIGDVKTGDNVHVRALVKDGTASAVEVMDVTQVRDLRERWLPRKPRPEPSPS